ncbi:extracellular solute-binding protein [Falsirhodobacter xinxiangensis]|uniref:extracellular solute-binding protein n=1 Tax=Falsirhodobacter xinxiangensis TaxID=2530049 RepID=UPI0010AAD31F|nr:extracellular solute-binding protein [Rhodobacter xinxiangensis]
MKHLALGTALSFLAGATAAQELNLYTTREPGLVEPLLAAFTASSGIEVNTIFLKEGLPERVEAEGDRSPADVMMTVDIGNLVDLVDRGLTQPVESEVLEAAIPESMRDADGQWFALSLRARALYAAKDLELTEFHYEDLADPEWKGRVCIRSGQHPYNIALTAAYIAHYDEAEAEAWLTGVHDNLARKAGGGDRDVARDIMGGLCDIGIANSYYVGQMLSGNGGPDQLEWVNAIRLVFPTFENGGTQINVSGAAVAKHAPNRDEAVALLEYLVSPEAQKIYAEANFEHPVNATAAVSPLIVQFGDLVPDTISLTEVARNRKAASELAEKVGFDN